MLGAHTCAAALDSRHGRLQRGFPGLYRLLSLRTYTVVHHSEGKDALLLASAHNVQSRPAPGKGQGLIN